MPFDERAKLWAKYSQYPFKRQLRSLWYYILNLRIDHKHLIQIRKYKDNPDKCLTCVPKNKYNFVPGTTLTRYFKGIKHTILVNDDGSFSYNGDKYVNPTYDRGKNGVLNVTDNNHLILKAFATAWKYKELYERDGDIHRIFHNEHTSPRQFYRHLDIAYMKPIKVNQILSGKLKINVNDLFQIARENHL